MGWASGASLADEIWRIILPYLGCKKDKIRVANELIYVFENRDCDTMCETYVWDVVTKPCPACGNGQDNYDYCEECDGYGRIKIE